VPFTKLEGDKIVGNHNRLTRASMAGTVAVDLDHRPPITFYLSVGLVAGSIIALQIGIMRVFSVAAGRISARWW